MLVRIGEEIYIEHPTDEIKQWCTDNLILPNPEFAKKQRMGFWTGNTPRYIYLYELTGEGYRIPYGCLKDLYPYLCVECDYESTFKPVKKVDFGGEIPLWEYQKEAVGSLLIEQYGILQSRAGSGKTQIGLALAKAIGGKTLWLTHTVDLLNQSKTRAEKFFDKSKFGTITGGKVNIGETITFATVQTMSRVALEKYKDEWDTIIVDECHRCCGSPTAVTMFWKVVGGLRARHKYGLSATVHRADGLIRATFALLGPVVHTIPDTAVGDKVMPATVWPIATDFRGSDEYLNSDGTTNYQAMITTITGDYDRNELIVNFLEDNVGHSNLILSDRVAHLNTLRGMLRADYQRYGAVIDGKSSKAYREQVLQDMRNGTLRYLFATYSLAKEGLDIPRLDRLYLVTPQKDYAVITQAVGRVQRTFPGKEEAWVYDFVDRTKGLVKAYKKRCTTYRKIGVQIHD